MKYSWTIPFLNCFGYWIKHRTRIHNEDIPILLFVIATSISIALRFSTSMYSGWYFWFDALFVYGVVNGLRLSLVACGGYEAVRGIRTTYKRRRGGKMIKKKSFLLMLVAFVSATLIFGLLSFVFGEDLWGIFTKLTDGWIFGVLFMLAFDITKRVVTDKESITKTYIVMVVLIFLNVVSFFTASYAKTLNWLIAGIACAVVFGVTAGLLPSVVNYIKNRRDGFSPNGKKAFTTDDIQNEWIKVRAKLVKAKDEKAKKEILYGFLAFRLKDDSIYNELDINQPLIKQDSFAMTVNSATKSGVVSEDSIDQAKSYIDSII